MDCIHFVVCMIAFLFFCCCSHARRFFFFFFLMIRRPPRSPLFPLPDALPISGGAAVIESRGATATLGTPVRITAVAPPTENMPSGHAMKPGDIVTAMNGKTIEINNTDEIGRALV